MKKTSILLLVGLLSACSASFDKESLSVNSESQFVNEGLTEKQIQIVSQDGTAVSGATVYIGVKGLKFTADVDGKVNIPATWVTEETITIEAPGFMRTSYVDELPVEQTFKVSQLPPTVRYELKGKAAGFKDLKNDGWADFAMVMKTIDRADTLHFDISTVVSPEDDKIEIMGNEVNMPSNISLPSQTESYMFFPIGLEKEKYRYYFNELGPQNMYVAQAKMNFKNSVSKMTNKEPSYKVINEFNFIGGTLKTVNVVEAMPELDFKVGEFLFNTKSTFNMPAGSTTDPEVIIAGTLAQRSGQMIPLDFKWAQKPTVQLNTLANDQMFLIAVKKKEKDMQEPAPPTSPTSAYLVAADPKSKTEFLPFVKSPKVVKDPNVLSIESDLPQIDNGTSAQGMMLTLEQTETIVVSEEKTKQTVHRYWEVYSKNWKNKITLPNLSPLILGQQRVTVNFLSSMQPQILVEPRMMMVLATHLTSNSAQY